MILCFVIVFVTYGISVREGKKQNGDEPERLIVLEETPEISTKDVDDPYKPKIEETQTADDAANQNKTSVPVKNKSRIPTRISKNTSSYDVPRPGDSIDYTKVLDSLQKTSGKDTTGKNISGNYNGNSDLPDSLIYKIPDSLKASVDTVSVAIRIRAFPKEWKFQRVDDKSFYLYFGGDSVNSRGDSVTMFMYLNSKAPEDDIKNFTRDFKLNDSLNTSLIAKTIEPKSDPGLDKMVYRYIISGKADRLNVKANVNKKYLENNVTVIQTIEAIVRSISFRNPN